MRLKSALVFVLFGCSAFLIPGPVLSENASSKPRRITLLIRRHTGNNDNYERASVSFRDGLHYDRVRGVKTDRDLLYGALNFNGDRDWFSVALTTRDRSRIRDLGKMDWLDDMTVPVLPILPCPTNESCPRPIRIPSSLSGKKIQDEDVNPHMAKPLVGHMYLVHVHDREPDLSVHSNLYTPYTPLDFYILFRVEELKANESCTITWKRIPSPKT